MKTRKAYKYRLYPSKTQVKSFENTLQICRELYNACLQERRDAYRTWERVNKGIALYPICDGVFFAKENVSRPDAPPPPQINYYTQANQLPELKKIWPELGAVHSQVLQNVLKRVDLAFQAFFLRVKQGETPGYPRFKGKYRYDSFTYPGGGWSLRNNKLTIHGAGIIKLKLHREAIGKVKTCTIKREGEKWFVVFSLESELEVPLQHEGPAVGIDVGLEHFANLSNGEQIENPRFYRKAEKRLAKAQRQWSAVKKLGRDNPKRGKKGLAVKLAHKKIANCRKDFQDKLSRELVKRFSLIVVEDLKIRNLVRKAKPKEDADNPGQFLPNGGAAQSGRSKSIQDAGWATFIAKLGYKAEEAGSKLIEVDPRNTSRTCPECGLVAVKKLSERWHSCECGCEMHRDVAAAIVILSRGLATLRNQSVEAPRL